MIKQLLILLLVVVSVARAQLTTNIHFLGFENGVSSEVLSLATITNGVQGFGPFSMWGSTGGQAFTITSNLWTTNNAQTTFDGAVSIMGTNYYTTGSVGIACLTEKAYNYRFVPGYHGTNFVSWSIFRIDAPETDTSFSFDWFTAFNNIASDFINLQLVMINNAMRASLELSGQPPINTLHSNIQWFGVAAKFMGTNYAMVFDMNTNFLWGATNANVNLNTFSNQSILLHSMAGTHDDVSKVNVDCVYIDASTIPRWPPVLPIQRTSSPTNFTAIRIPALGDNNGRIKLDWTVSNSYGLTGFLIERSLNGTDFTPIAGVSDTTRTYTDTGLPLGVTEYYRIGATNFAFNTVSIVQSTNAALDFGSPYKSSFFRNFR